MKVKDLMEAILAGKEENEDFLDWDVYIEREHPGGYYNVPDNGEEYVHCFGRSNRFTREKIFLTTIAKELK